MLSLVCTLDMSSVLTSHKLHMLTSDQNLRNYIFAPHGNGILDPSIALPDFSSYVVSTFSYPLVLFWLIYTYHDRLRLENFYPLSFLYVNRKSRDLSH